VSQVKERIYFNAVGAAARAGVGRSFGELVGGARLFDQTQGIWRFKPFENLVECLFFLLALVSPAFSPLAAINGGRWGKAETIFRENFFREVILRPWGR
jgi:hypothetical protein